MVKNQLTRSLLAALLMLVVTCDLVATESSQTVVAGEQQVEVAPLRLPGISRLVIVENGATAPAVQEAQPQCAKFRLGARDVREYLRVAQVVSQHDYLHALDWSPCFASGTVLFGNGLTGVWGIQQFRAGSLKLSDGRELFLFCPQCRSRAFPAF